LADAVAPVLGRTGGQAVVDALAAGGVEAVFGIPGGHNLDIYDALAGMPTIRTIVPRHEQGAGFMADGYARVSGRTGVTVTIEGPGATNLLTSLGEAYADHSPVLAITSQIPAADIDRHAMRIHELRDHQRVLASACLWNERATTVEAIPGLIARALADHRTKRPAPIHLEVPLDVLAARSSETDGFEPTGPAPLDPAEVARAAEVIAAGSRPLIYAGAGVNRSGAAGALTLLAERLGAPVITTALGKGAIAEDHPLYVATLSLWSPWATSGPVAELVAAADPLIVVGGRLSDASTNDWSMPLPSPIVQIDIEPEQAQPRHRAGVTVAGDAAAALGQLLGALGTGRSDSVALDEAREHVAAHARANLGWGQDLLDAITSDLGPDTILMGDSLIGLWAATAWRTNAPRAYHVPMHFNTLGFALPAAVGARVAMPTRPIVAIAGEGAFMFTMAELSTAVQHELPVIMIVCNDGAFTSIKRQQVARFGRTHGVDLASPDLPRLADAMGALGLRADDLAGFRGALATAAASGRPALIEVPLSVRAPWEA
jgi:acetolactate synthase-1/2/3 large subunit